MAVAVKTSPGARSSGSPASPAILASSISPAAVVSDEEPTLTTTLGAVATSRLGRAVVIGAA